MQYSPIQKHRRQRDPYLARATTTFEMWQGKIFRMQCLQTCIYARMFQFSTHQKPLKLRQAEKDDWQRQTKLSQSWALWVNLILQQQVGSSQTCQTPFPMWVWARKSPFLLEAIPCNLPAMVPNVNLTKKWCCRQSMFWPLIPNILATLSRIPLDDDRCRKAREQLQVTIKFLLWSVTFWQIFRGQIFSCFVLFLFHHWWKPDP